MDEVTRSFGYYENGVFKFGRKFILRQGKSFGYLELRNKEPRTTSVLCLEDTHFVVIDKKDYL